MNRKQEIEKRLAEIRQILSSDKECDIDALEKEIKSLTEERAEIETKEKRQSMAAGIQSGDLESRKIEKPDDGKDNKIYAEPKQPEWRSLGEFIHTVASNPTDGRLIESRDQTLGTGSEGGFLVPEQFATQLLTVEPDEAIVRPRSRIFTGAESDLHIPAIQYSGNNMYGGVAVQWIDEGVAKPETEAEFKRITLHSYEVAAHVPVTDKLMRNTSMIETVVRDMLRGALVNAEEDTFLNGAGGVQPTGIIGHAATIGVARAAGAAVAYADLVNMYQRFRGRKGVWVIARSVLSELMTMQDAAGHPIWQPNARDGKPGTLLGFPVLISDNSPALGVAGDVLLADFSHYLIKDGFGIAIEASKHVQFLNNVTVIKAFKTVDATPWLTGVLPTTPTTSPFVQLNA